LASIPVTETVYVATGVLREVDTVSTAVTALALPTVTEEGLMAQMGAALPPFITVHDRPTPPV
jgi:hypothetical protein